MTIELNYQIAVADGARVPDIETMQRWLQVAPLRQDSGLTVRVVHDAESAALNLQYRGKQGATNVLSFPFDPPELGEELGGELADEGYLGDLVIAAEVVIAEAKAQNKAVDAHWAHILLHGVLHLLGYDHQNDDEAAEMEGLEKELLAQLNFADPYEVE